MPTMTRPRCSGVSTQLEALLALCRDRTPTSPEFHEFNNFYGHATVLKRYAALSETRPLKVAIEHGYAFQDGVHATDLNTLAPVFLCSSSRRARVFESKVRGRVRAIPIGPLICYAGSAVNEPRSSAARLVAFPAHSTHRINAKFDHQTFIQRITRLGRSFDETLVCLYWRDVLRGTARPYLEAGLRCVSAGHIFDPLFLPRLRRIISAASVVYTNRVGTQVIYAVTLDRLAWVEDMPVSHTAREGTDLRAQVLEDPVLPIFDQIAQAFPVGTTTLSPSQRSLIADFSGADSVRSAVELRAILDDAERDYRASATLRHRLGDLRRSARYVSSRSRATFTSAFEQARRAVRERASRTR